MATSILERPPQPRADGTVDEQLALDLARFREVPDWERLMEVGITPALLVAGERRLNRR